MGRASDIVLSPCRVNHALSLANPTIALPCTMLGAPQYACRLLSVQQHDCVCGYASAIDLAIVTTALVEQFKRWAGLTDFE